MMKIQYACKTLIAMLKRYRLYAFNQKNGAKEYG